MSRFPNGQLPSSHLVEVEIGLHLETATAAAYLRMKAAAARDGVQLAIPRPAGAYRSLFVQQDMHDRPWLYNLDPNSIVPIAAAGSSTHGDGTRVDIVRGTAGDWAIRNAIRFGFVREFGAADPRHFRYTAPSWAAASPDTPITPTRRRKSMTTLYYTKDDTGNLYGLAGDGLGTAAWLETRDTTLATALAVQHGNAAYLSPSSFSSWKQRYLDGAKPATAPAATEDASGIVAAIKALPDAIAKAIKSLIFR